MDSPKPVKNAQNAAKTMNIDSPKPVKNAQNGTKTMSIQSHAEIL